MGSSCIGWNQPGCHRWRARTRRTASCSTACPLRHHSAGHLDAEQPWRNSDHPAGHLDAGSNHDADALTFRDGHADANPDNHCYADANPDNHCYADADADNHCHTDADWHLHAIAVDQRAGNQYRPANTDDPGGTDPSIGHRPAAGSC